MKIIIAGAGEIGFHLAQSLAKENQDITLIDTNEEVLDYAGAHLDVMTIKGNCTSPELLILAEVAKAQLVIAVTTSETTNLLTSMIAKKIGAKKTIARVSNPEYLKEVQSKRFMELGVDNIFSPSQMASEEISRLLKRCSLSNYVDFENGKISLIGTTIDNSSSLAGMTIRAIDQERNCQFKPIAISRRNKTIIPFGDTIIEKSDHIICVTTKNEMDSLMEFVGKDLRDVANIMIIGGSDVAFETAKLLENDFNITIVEKSNKRCEELVEILDHALVIKGDPSNIDLLKEEGLSNMDAFIALTPNAEINIITSLMAEDSGVYKTIAMVDKRDYIHISKNIGIDTMINKKLVAADHIFRHVRQGKVEAIAHLDGIDVEFIEFTIESSKRVTKKLLRNLKFPPKTMICGVIRGDEAIIPDGDFQLALQDKVIVITSPDSLSEVEKMFK